MSDVITIILLVLAIAGVVLGAVGTVLHLIAPRTKSTWDDRAAVWVDSLRAEVAKITDALKSVIPQPPQVPAPVIAVVPPATAATVEVKPPDSAAPPPVAPRTRTATVPTPSGSSGGGSAASLALAFIFAALATGAIACAANGTKLRAVEDGLAKCTAPELAQGVAALEPLMSSVVLAATSADGKQIDDSKLQSALSKTSLETDAGQFALCAVADVFAALLSPAPATTGAPAAAPLQIDPAAATAAFERIRAARAPGVRFATSHGAI